MYGYGGHVGHIHGGYGYGAHMGYGYGPHMGYGYDPYTDYGYEPHMGYGYGYPGGRIPDRTPKNPGDRTTDTTSKPRPRLIKEGDEVWLDDMEEISVQKEFCSSTIKVKADGFEVRFIKKSGGCYNSYDAEYEGKVVAFFGNMGGCAGGARFVQCPPGREVLTAAIRREGYGRAGQNWYTAFQRGSSGAGGLLLRRPMYAGSCGSNLPITDGVGRIIANVSEASCRCCGEILRISFVRDASAIEKLGVIDWALTAVDTGSANPCRWSICLVFLLPLLFFIIFAATLATLSKTASDRFDKQNRF